MSRSMQWTDYFSSSVMASCMCMVLCRIVLTMGIPVHLLANVGTVIFLLRVSMYL